MASMFYFKEKVHSDIPICIEFLENPIAVNGKKDEAYNSISFPTRMINKGKKIITPNKNGGDDYVVKNGAEFTWEVSDALHGKIKDFSEKELCRITYITKTKTNSFWKVEMITKDDLPDLTEPLSGVDYRNQSIESQSAMKNAIELVIHGKAEVKQLSYFHRNIFNMIRSVQVEKVPVEEVPEKLEENEEQAQEKEVEKELAIQEEKKEMTPEEELFRDIK
tara:strand:- start:32 stop:694 length:663 start_codon:yes stop_codon:yes gene_type:complete